MRKLALSLIMFTACATWAIENAPVLPDFPKVRYSPNFFYSSEGFRLGYITKIDWTGILIWTYEGQLALGVSAGPDKLLNQTCVDDKTVEAQKIRDPVQRQLALDKISQACAIVDNPWPFSFMESKLYDQYNRMQAATPVVIYYQVPLISPKQIVTKTSNYIYEIYPINENYPVQKHFEISSYALPVSIHLNPERDEIVGRVVKASLDHYLFKTYEVIIQKNVLGNNFTTMSLNDKALFDQLVRAMLTGKVLRIGYVRLFDWQGDVYSLRGYDTDYRIISVDVLDATEVQGVEGPGQAQ